MHHAFDIHTKNTTQRKKQNMQAVGLRLHGKQRLLREQRNMLLPCFSSVGQSSALAGYRTRTEPPRRLPPVLEPPNPPRPQTPKPEKSFFEKVWDRYSPEGHRHRVRRAEELFQAATRQANDPRWYGPGRIKGTEFRQRHALLTMHVWFLHKRLISDVFDKDRALMIQEELFNILWEDTTCRIRKAGVSELLVNKNLLQVQQYTFLHLTNYDHVYTELLDKPEERLQELRNIVWRHILVRDEDAEHRIDHLDRIAWYIEANYQNIMMHWPDEYYRDARVAWVDLPDFTNMRDAKGRVLEEQPVNPDDVLPDPWLQNITLKGLDYYWNPETRQVRWDRPTASKS